MRKRILTAGLTFALLLGAVGCGNASATNTETDNTEAAKVEETSEEVTEASEEETEEATEEAEKEENDKDIVAGAVASSTDSTFVYTGDPVTIKVGASITPHAEILREAQPILAEQGITLEIVELEDYVTPNVGVIEGSLDANYFQHTPYLDDFNAENGTHLVAVASIHFEPFAIYGGKTKSLDDLKDGATVAVPNDTTNEARASLLLEAQGLIKLKADVGLTATVLDIEENPLNLEIKEVEAAQVARSIDDVDIIAVNGNYALEAGLSSSDALAYEAADSLAADTYKNVLVVKEGNENSEETKALIKALNSDEVRDYINNTYEGQVVPVF